MGTRTRLQKPSLVAALLALLLGALLLMNAPAVRGAEVSAYGCPATLAGSPVGGGPGYLNAVSPGQARYVVSTGSQLKSALAAATSGQVVYVADGATITIDSSNWYGTSKGRSYGCYVKAGVTLAGGRGRAGVTGGIIRISPNLYPKNNGGYVAIGCGAGADVCGLTVVGMQDGTSGGSLWAGVWAGVSSEIHNNEIHGFGYGGVIVYRSITGAWIHHNYIHHCQQEGYGYAVGVCGKDIYTGASALVEGNIIDHARHFISGEKGRTSYTFRYNQLGAHCTNSQIDCHGQNDEYPDYAARDGAEYVYPAGDVIAIYNNTSFCTNQVLVGIRGLPYSAGSISVHHNWSYLPSTYRWSHINQDGTRFLLGPIAQYMDALPGYRYSAPQGGAFVRMEEHDNWWGTAAPPAGGTANRPPLAPGVPSGAVSGQTGSTYAYSVKTSDPDGDKVAYTIEWGDGTSSTTGQAGSGVSASSGHAWAQPGTFAVRARATDSRGSSSAWSPALSVTIAGGAAGGAAPPVPTLLSPADGAVISGTSCPLDWSTVTGSTGILYGLQVDNNADFSSPMVNKTLSASYYRLSSMPDGVFYWRVKAVDEAGSASAWTAGRSFNMS